VSFVAALWSSGRRMERSCVVKYSINELFNSLNFRTANRTRRTLLGQLFWFGIILASADKGCRVNFLSFSLSAVSDWQFLWKKIFEFGNSQFFHTSVTLGSVTPVGVN
jgi:hypothetical protein